MGERDKDNTSTSHVSRLAQDRSLDELNNIELDPRVIKAGFDLSGYYIETGLKSFSDYAQKMVEQYGHDVRPYLKSWYLAVRYYPGIDPTGMDSAVLVDEITVF